MSTTLHTIPQQRSDVNNATLAACLVRHHNYTAELHEGYTTLRKDGATITLRNGHAPEPHSDTARADLAKMDEEATLLVKLLRILETVEA